MNAILFSGITVLIYLIINLLALIISILPLRIEHFTKLRIQRDKLNFKQFRKRRLLITMNILLVCLLSFIGLNMIYPMMIQNVEFHFISVIIQVAVILFLDDLFFYFLHRWLHNNSWAMSKIHSIHNEASAPFALDYIYAHPLEWLLGYIGPVIGFVFILFMGNLSVWTVWIYVFIRGIHEVDIHCGYQSTISKYLPFLGDTEHHDRHHKEVVGNFGSTLTFWDTIMGTKIK